MFKRQGVNGVLYFHKDKLVEGYFSFSWLGGLYQLFRQFKQAARPPGYGPREEKDDVSTLRF